MFARRWRLSAAGGVLAAILSAAAAEAAPRIYLFDIPPQRLDLALLALGTQGDLSINAGGALHCRPSLRRVAGRQTVEAALKQLLAGTGCAYRFLDPRAVDVFVAPRRVAPPATAEPSAAQETLSLDPVIVVATRRPTRSARLAYAVSAVDAATLTGLGARDASDLALITPSMTVTNLGAGRDKILIRGLSDGPLTGRTQSMVGIYLDDVRLTYNAPDPDLLLIDMAQVEVLRGPQGALYGAGSLGGVLHLISSRPNAEAREGWISVAGGLTRAGAPSNTVEAMINLPIFGGRGAIRAVGYREDQGGWIDDPASGRKSVNRTQRQGGRLAATLALTDRWSLSLGLVGQEINASDTQYLRSDSRPFRRDNAIQEPHDNDFAEAHVSLIGTLAGSEAHMTAAIVRNRLTTRYDATVSPPVRIPPGPAAFDDEDAITSLVTEATLTSKATAATPWLVGLFYSHSRDTLGLGLKTLGQPTLEAFHETRHDDLEEAAVFGEATLPLSEALSVTLGGRAFFSDAHAVSTIQIAGGGAPPPFSGDLSHTAFVPKAMISYTVGPSLTIYAQAAKGYRSGGINTTGPAGQMFSDNGSMQPNRYYQGDRLWSYEIGLRASLFAHRLSVRSAIFESVWTTIQSDQLLPSGLPFTANIGDAHNPGLEFEGIWADGPLRVQGDVLVNHPELSRANSAFPARRDLALAGVPGAAASVSARYEWPLGEGRRLELDGRYAYVGASHLTFDALTSPAQGAYGTGRLAASLVDARWRLTLAVDNPFDARGDTFAYGNPFTLRTTPQVTPLRPRTLTLGLRVAY